MEGSLYGRGIIYIRRFRTVTEFERTVAVLATMSIFGTGFGQNNQQQQQQQQQQPNAFGQPSSFGSSGELNKKSRATLSPLFIFPQVLAHLARTPHSSSSSNLSSSRRLIPCSAI